MRKLKTARSGGSLMTDLRVLIELAKPRRTILAVAALLSVVATVTDLAQPLVVGWVLDAVGTGRSVWGKVAFLIILFGLGTGFSALQGYLLGRVGEDIVLDLRRKLVRHLLRMPVAEHDLHRIGDLVSRVGADATLLRTVLSSSLTNALAGSLTFVGAVVLMAITDFFLLSVALLCVTVATGIVLLASNKVREASKEAQKSVGALSAALERALSAIRTVKAGGAERREESAISRGAEAAYRAGVRAAKLEAAVWPATGAALQGSFVLVLALAGARLASGAITIGELVTFLLYLLYVVGPLTLVFASFTDLQRGLAALARVREVLDLPAEEKLFGQARHVKALHTASRAIPSQDLPTVSFSSVSFAYENVGRGPGRQVLHELSFVVPKNSHTAIVGPSGAGKSTVFALIERFYEPQVGAIYLDGVNVRELHLDDLRRRIGYVEQNSPVLAGTLRENLLFVNPGATEEELAEALELANLRAFVECLPAGLDTGVGDAGVLLSGGERQRVAIARVLVDKPHLLLLDEATSQLDARSEKQIRDATRRASRKCTVISIAHRLSTVVDADQIIILDKGSVKGMGTHKELLETNPLYQELAISQLIGPSEESEQTSP